MKVLHKTEYKHNHQYYLVECTICGHKRNVSLSNLKKRGSLHSESTCRGDYFKSYMGTLYGDYKVIGHDNCTNKLILECIHCGHQYKSYLSGLGVKNHNASTCKEDYYLSKVGKIYGDFKVISYTKLKSNHKYICECTKCGRCRDIKPKDLDLLKFSHTNCVDLLPKDTLYITLQRRYQNIVARCTNPNNTNYKYYGAKGVKCEFTSFIDFYDTYSTALKDDITLTFDRIDVNGNYSTDNIRLVNKKTQQSNKTTTRYFIAINSLEKVLCNNAMEFGRYVGINGRSVGNCLRGNSKSAGGWKFINLTLEEFNDLLNDRSVTTKLIV